MPQCVIRPRAEINPPGPRLVHCGFSGVERTEPRFDPRKTSKGCALSHWPATQDRIPWRMMPARRGHCLESRRCAGWRSWRSPPQQLKMPEARSPALQSRRAIPACLSPQNIPITTPGRMEGWQARKRMAAALGCQDANLPRWILKMVAFAAGLPGESPRALAHSKTCGCRAGRCWLFRVTNRVWSGRRLYPPWSRSRLWRRPASAL